MKFFLCTNCYLLLQGMYNNGMPRQGNQQQPQQAHMYPGGRYGPMAAQYQSGYSGFNNGYPPQQGANNMASTGYSQQQQQFQPGYNNQQHPGYPQQQQWYPNGQGYDQSSWNQQQQQHMGWNNGMNQWTGQQPSTWSNNMSPRNETSTQNMYNNSQQQQQMQPPPAAATAASQQTSAPVKDPKTATATGSKTNVEMQPEAYQRTLEYVQSCQSWSNNSVMSPDSSSINGAKSKRSPTHQATEGTAAATAMPPPASMTPGQGDNTNNMIIGDMSSSMNLLNEETRFLHMMQ